MFSLVYNDNDTAHDDVTVTLAAWRQVCDSYYFAIDEHFLQDREDAPKVRQVIRVLLHHWLQAVVAQQVSQALYLPFDLSDQYTGCLRCLRVSETCLELTPGYTHREGWSFLPSRPTEFFGSVPDFIVTGAPVEIPSVQFQSEIQASIENLEQSDRC